jgi:hypothetical protein
MDKEAKILFLSVFETLRELNDAAFEAQEMAWKTSIALTRAEVPGYEKALQAPSGFSFDEIHRLRNGIKQRLGAEIQRLEASIQNH